MTVSPISTTPVVATDTPDITADSTPVVSSGLPDLQAGATSTYNFSVILDSLPAINFVIDREADFTALVNVLNHVVNVSNISNDITIVSQSQSSIAIVSANMDAVVSAVDNVVPNLDQILLAAQSVQIDPSKIGNPTVTATTIQEAFEQQETKTIYGGSY